MGRSPCCDKSNVKRGPWSPEEDWILKKYVERNGTGGNWISLPQKAGLKRCGKSCRLRWLNYLRPGIKHGGFTEEEDNIISTIYQTLGSRWSVIASHLPGRTDNDIKNYWNTKLKKTKTSILPNQTKNNTTPITGINPMKPGTHARNNNGGFLIDQFKPIPVQPLAELPNKDVSAVSATSSSSISVDNVFSQVTWLESGGGGASDDLFSMNIGFQTSSDLLDWYGLGEHFIHGEEDMFQSAMQG